MPQAVLPELQQALLGLQIGSLSPHAFCVLARSDGTKDLLGRLPPQFAPVWWDLIDRLESSALFDAESCSFSHKDLHDGVQIWLDKAHARLSLPPLA